MTRWARANNVHKHKPAEATPWNQLRTGGAGRGNGHPGSSGSSAGAKQGPQRDYLRRTQPGGSAVKKPNRKKKDYLDEDVNGFLEYLQQTRQPLPRGDRGGGWEERGLREEVETALKKDRRREDRRVKRQSDKKNNMVSKFTQHIPDTELALFPSSHKSPCFLPLIPFLVSFSSPAMFQLQEARSRFGRLSGGRPRRGDGPRHLLPLRLHRT